MKKYIQPAIYVFELKMENALLSSSNVELKTVDEYAEGDEYTRHTIWNNNAWPYEE